MKTSGISSAIISAIGVLWILIKKINNKRFHSSCCGRDVDVVVAVNDIEEAEKKPTPHPSPVIRPISEPMNIEKLDLEK